MSLEITPRLIDEIVAYFDRADDAARLWKGLCFMERHGIDLALRSAELIGYLRDHPNSPVPDARSLSGEDLRELVLGIRERVRQVTGLPPLGRAERDAWRLERRPPRPPVVRKSQSKRFGENRWGGLDPAIVYEELVHEDGELMRAVELFASQNGPLTEENAESQESYIWFRDELDDMIFRLHPSIGGIDALEISETILGALEASDKPDSGGCGANGLLRLSPRWATFGLALALIGCSSKYSGRSAETEFLQRAVVPQILQWSNSSEAVLSLGPLVRGRGYEELCLVREYGTLSDIDGNAARPVARYHSDFSSMVTEGHAALIAIKGGEAHAVLVSNADVFLRADPDIPCFQADQAVLEREALLPGFTTPVAHLGEVE